MYFMNKKIDKQLYAKCEQFQSHSIKSKYLTSDTHILQITNVKSSQESAGMRLVLK